VAGTSSPDSTVPPSSNLASRPERSTLPSRDRNVSGDRPAQHRAEHLLLAPFLADLELDLAAQRADHSGQVAHPGNRRFGRPGQRRPAHRGRGRAFRGGDGEPRGDPGTRVDGGRLAHPRVNLAITSTRWSGSSAAVQMLASCLIRVSSSVSVIG